MLRRPILTAAVLWFGTLPGLAAGEPEIGTTLVVKNQVVVEFEDEKRKLQKGNKVYQQEIVQTGKSASAEIRLLDDTKLAVGADARLVLDKFVYDASPQPGSVAVNLAKGAFRFISGTSGSAAYEIRTPTATMGVRGTVFDVYVADNGETAVLLHQGAVDVCPTPATCRRHDIVGRFVHVNLQRLASLPLPWDGSFMPGVRIASAFPFVGRTLVIDPVRRLRHADLLAPASQATRAAKGITNVPNQIQKAIPKRLPF